MKVKGFHDLRNQEPPVLRQLMVIQSMGLPGITDWPMRMSWRGRYWAWEPSGKPSSTYPTHWRRRQLGDEQYDKLPALPPTLQGVSGGSWLVTKVVTT